MSPELVGKALERWKEGRKISGEPMAIVMYPLWKNTVKKFVSKPALFCFYCSGKLDKNTYTKYESNTVERNYFNDNILPLPKKEVEQYSLGVRISKPKQKHPKANITPPKIPVRCGPMRSSTNPMGRAETSINGSVFQYMENEQNERRAHIGNNGCDREHKVQSEVLGDDWLAF